MINTPILSGRTLIADPAVEFLSGYSRPEFLNTSETIEFFLDFSAGMMAGG
jgi:hypothetical protein